jgi:hypothetical protein
MIGPKSLWNIQLEPGLCKWNDMAVDLKFLIIGEMAVWTPEQPYTIGSSKRRNSYMYDLLYVGSAKGSDIELMPKNSYGGAHGNSD